MLLNTVKKEKKKQKKKKGKKNAKKLLFFLGEAWKRLFRMLGRPRKGLIYKTRMMRHR